MVPIYMACDLDPFRDVRVRQAMRLIADRPALVEAAQLGFGSVGNDVFGYKQPEYNTELDQRVQDIDQAKSLLKAAGKSDLRITLYSSTVSPGMLESATAFAQQAKAAGVTIDVNNGPASSYFGPKYLKQNFAQTQWPAFALYSWYQQAMAPNAPFNETHWSDPQWDKLYNQTQATLDDTKRKEMNFELQRILWERGGYLIWGFYPAARRRRQERPRRRAKREQRAVATSTSRTSGSRDAEAGSTLFLVDADVLDPPVSTPRSGSAHPLAWFLAKRIVAAAVTLFAISILIFVGTSVLPGDAASAILGRDATPSSLAALREQLHLNQPLTEQYARWIGGVLHGDLGRSAASGIPITTLISDPVKNSAILAGCAALLLIPLALVLGVLAATRAGRGLDHFISLSSLGATALPEFVTGTILILVFALHLNVLPAVSFLHSRPEPAPGSRRSSCCRWRRCSRPRSPRPCGWCAPAWSRRSASDYVEMARLNGYAERSVVLRARTAKRARRRPSRCSR